LEMSNSDKSYLVMSLPSRPGASTDLMSVHSQTCRDSKSCTILMVLEKLGFIESILTRD
jgi:hypothetical protein